MMQCQSDFPYFKHQSMDLERMESVRDFPWLMLVLCVPFVILILSVG